MDPTHDLDTHAAMILATDLVVSVSTATAHIAAVLGHPTWVLLPRAQPSFLYWSKAGDNETWYSSVTKITPGPGENWGIVSDKIVEMIETCQGR
jgi:ADP-heptose:LPS heptosyltransferase